MTAGALRSDLPASAPVTATTYRATGSASPAGTSRHRPRAPADVRCRGSGNDSSAPARASATVPSSSRGTAGALGTPDRPARARPPSTEPRRWARAEPAQPPTPSTPEPEDPTPPGPGPTAAVATGTGARAGARVRTRPVRCRRRAPTHAAARPGSARAGPAHPTALAGAAHPRPADAARPGPAAAATRPAGARATGPARPDAGTAVSAAAGDDRHARRTGQRVGLRTAGRAGRPAGAGRPAPTSGGRLGPAARLRAAGGARASAAELAAVHRRRLPRPTGQRRKLPSCTARRAAPTGWFRPDGTPPRRDGRHPWRAARRRHRPGRHRLRQRRGAGFTTIAIPANAVENSGSLTGHILAQGWADTPAERSSNTRVMIVLAAALGLLVGDQRAGRPAGQQRPGRSGGRRAQRVSRRADAMVSPPTTGRSTDWRLRRTAVHWSGSLTRRAWCAPMGDLAGDPAAQPRQAIAKMRPARKAFVDHLC